MKGVHHFMECPYCQKQMKKGYIPTSQMSLMWIPENERLPRTVFFKNKTGVNLTKYPMWKMQKAESFYCNTCRIVITPVKRW